MFQKRTKGLSINKASMNSLQTYFLLIQVNGMMIHPWFVEIFKVRKISWNRNIFSVLQIDEDALFSSNRSFEDWQDEIEAELDSNGDDINLERSKYDSKPGTPTYDSRSELSRFELKAEKNRKNRAILKLLTQKMDGTQE